jgi:ADP-heptose:LPS heptosyltransferase
LLKESGIAANFPFLAINPTEGGYGHKGWGVECHTALIKILQDNPGIPIVLVGGVEDRELGASISRLTAITNLLVCGDMSAQFGNPRNPAFGAFQGAVNSTSLGSRR